MPDEPKTEALGYLKSIDASLRELVRLLSANAPKAVAPDRDLDGKYGDPEVKFNPRDWTGANMTGRHFSQCPAEFLDVMAETLDWFAKKAEEKNETTANGKPVAFYKRQDAARARGWAKRVREGLVAQPPDAQGAEQGSWADDGNFTSTPMPTDDEVPF
jgi:hypothetical protein